MKTIPPIYIKALEFAVSVAAARHSNEIVLNTRTSKLLNEFTAQMQSDAELAEALNNADKKAKEIIDNAK